MPSADLREDRDLTLRAHGLLSDIDPARWRAERTPQLRAGLKEVATRMAHRRRLEPLCQALETEVPALSTGPLDERRRWLAFRRRMQPAYARVAASLSAEAVHVPSLRPTNHARSLLHVASAGGALLAIALAPTPSVLRALALSFCAAAWAMEAARRLDGRVNRVLMWAFGPVAHAHEQQRVNSATWYASALVLLALVGSPLDAAVGVVVLGVGDPVAGAVGRRFGRVKLMHGRTLEGSLGFVAAAAVATFLTLRGLHAQALTVPQAAFAALAAAFSGGLAELVSLRLDDNFTIPLCAAAGAALALGLAGAP
jgi:dolichol kinase